jgi:hypothetical protein
VIMDEVEGMPYAPEPAPDQDVFEHLRDDLT